MRWTPSPTQGEDKRFLLTKRNFDQFDPGCLTLPEIPPCPSSRHCSVRNHGAAPF